MKTKLWILEFELMGKDECEVEFEGYPKYYPAEPQTLEYPGDDETWECEDVTYDKSKYTESERKIIDTYLVEASEGIIQNAKHSALYIKI